MKKQLLIGLAMALFASHACQKDDPAPEPGPATADLLLGKWNLSQLITEEPGEALNECDKRTYFEFKTDKTFVLASYFMNPDDECVVGGETAGTYDLADGGKYLVLDPGSKENLTTIEILSISATQLRMEGAEIEGTMVFVK